MAARKGTRRRTARTGPGQRGNKKGARGRRAEDRVRAEYEKKGWRMESRRKAGSDFRATRPGRTRPLHVEVKTGSGKLSQANKATRRAVGRKNYVVEWRATRRRDGQWVGRRRAARVTRRADGKIIRESKDSITWQ